MLERVAGSCAPVGERQPVAPALAVRVATAQHDAMPTHTNATSAANHDTLATRLTSPSRRVPPGRYLRWRPRQRRTGRAALSPRLLRCIRARSGRQQRRGGFSWTRNAVCDLDRHRVRLLGHSLDKGESVATGHAEVRHQWSACMTSARQPLSRARVRATKSARAIARTLSATAWCTAGRLPPR